MDFSCKKTNIIKSALQEKQLNYTIWNHKIDQKSHMGSPRRPVFNFILIPMSLIRFQVSKQDLIGSSLLNKRETGSS